MALQVTHIKREFIFKMKGKDVPLKDPGSDLTPQEVMKLYAGTYAELTNGIIEGPKIVDDKATYTFKTQAGQLG